MGRTAELRVLDDLVRRVCDGTGATVLVSGEAGIGKTRLLRAAQAAAATAGATVAVGHGWADEGAPPLWPWVQVMRTAAAHVSGPVDAGLGSVDLAALVPELADRLRTGSADTSDTAHEPFYLRDAAVTVLAEAARARPVVICLDDLHWTDVASIHLASHLAGAVPRLPIGLVVSWRDGEGTPELAAALEGLRELAVPLPLGGLDSTACAELAELRTGARPTGADRDALRERTGGNPFFVEDLLASSGVSDGLPHRTRATLVARLDRLDAPVRALLEIASVVGRTFHPSVVSAVAGVTPDAVTRAIAAAASAGLVEPAANGAFRFRHALLAEAVSGTIEPTRRAAHHLACAALADRASPEPAATADIARHLLAALPHADREAARAAAVRAARNALDRRAHDDAAQWFRRALTCLGEGPSADAERARLLMELGNALLGGSGVDEAVGVFEAAEATAARAGDATARVEALVCVTEARYRAPGLDLDERTRLLLADAIDALDESQPVLTTRAAEQLARLEIMVGHGDQALEAARRAADVARDCAEPAAVAAARRARRWALVGPYPLEEKSAATAALVGTSEDLAAAWDIHYWRMLDALERGDRAGFDAGLSASRSLTERLREPFHVSLTGAWEVCLALIEGRFADAEAGAQAALAIMDAAGVDPAGVLAQTMYLARERGELDGYDGLLAGLAAAVPDRSAVYQAILALVLADQGRAADAAAELGRLAADDFRGVPVNGHWLTALMFCAEACAVLGDRDAAAALRPLLMPHRDRCIVAGAGPYLFLGAVAHHCGSLAVVAGEPGAALEDLETARRMHTGLGARPWAARTDHEISRALRLRDGPGDREAAAAAADRARRGAETLGMSSLLARITETSPLGAGAAMVSEDGSWHIAFAGTSFGLPDSKGLRCLAVLLGQPTVDVPVTDLAREALDDAPDDVEKARVNVTRQLKAAIARIEEHHPPLAQHLRTAVRTGRRCAYRPAGTPPEWHLG